MPVFSSLWAVLGANMAVAYHEFLYLSLDGSVGPCASACGSDQSRVNFPGSCCVARPQCAGFPDVPVVSGVCEMEQLVLSATQKNKTWAWVAREECGTQANTAGV